MAKQVRLTAEQGQKFYKEYLIAKNKRLDPDAPLDFITWKNYVEEFLMEESKGGAQWSNTEIRSANRIVARSGETLSRKQNNAFVRYVMREGNEEVRVAFAEKYGLRNADESTIKQFIREHEGAARSFLVGYSDNWNEFFNS